MIQNFDVQGGPDYGRKNLPKLRQALRTLGLGGFIIPHEDEYNNEYLPDCNERLMWATGFTGSAGASIVLTDKAAMFVDGRYTLQVRTQVDGNLFAYERLEDSGMAAWLKDNAAGLAIGYDSKLHSPDALARLEKAVKTVGGKLQAVKTNPIDQAWTNRPPATKAELTVQPLDNPTRTNACKLPKPSRTKARMQP